MLPDSHALTRGRYEWRIHVPVASRSLHHRTQVASMSGMRILVPGERTAGERRVAATPDTVAQLVVLGASVAIERGAGAAAGATPRGSAGRRSATGATRRTAAPTSASALPSVRLEQVRRRRASSGARLGGNERMRVTGGAEAER